MVAVAVAALTIYDMVKGAERGVEIRRRPPARRSAAVSRVLWLRRTGVETCCAGAII